MSRVSIVSARSLSLSLDGCLAGPEQDERHPLGEGAAHYELIRAESSNQWVLAEAKRSRHG